MFDKPLENLTAANFAVTDENGNPVAITSVAALDGNETYSLKGSFEVGKKYTVKVVLHGAAADATPSNDHRYLCHHADSYKRQRQRRQRKRLKRRLDCHDLHGYV